MLARAGVLRTQPSKLAVACFTITLREEAAAQNLQARVLLWTPATSLGGVASSVDWRHRWDPSQDARSLRLSVGVEDPEDLLGDLLDTLS